MRLDSTRSNEAVSHRRWWNMLKSAINSTLMFNGIERYQSVGYPVNHDFSGCEAKTLIHKFGHMLGAAIPARSREHGSTRCSSFGVRR